MSQHQVDSITNAAGTGGPSFPFGLLITPVNLTDVQATILGVKQYFVGTAYNGGVTPTLSTDTGTMVNTQSILMPYQTQDGSWRLKFSYCFSCTGAIAIPAGGFNVSISGVTHKNISNYFQSVSTSTDGVANIINFTYAKPNTGTILLHFGTSSNVNQTDYQISGDVLLDSKPTWAY